MTVDHGLSTFSSTIASRCSPFAPLMYHQVLLRAGLTVDCEFDTCGYTLLIKIGADVERLKFHAESVGYKMLLDPSCLQDVARSGVDEEQGLREPIRPFLIGHDPTVRNHNTLYITSG